MLTGGFSQLPLHVDSVHFRLSDPRLDTLVGAVLHALQNVLFRVTS